jgi:hypothetical protein
MLPFQLNLVENGMPTARNSGDECLVAPAISKEVSGGKGREDEHAATADAMHAAFVWLFGSGCF